MSANVDPAAAEVALVQQRIRLWLISTFPGVDPLVLLSALSYEIARTIARLELENGRSRANTDMLLGHVLTTMRGQIQAHRNGLPDDC